MLATYIFHLSNYLWNCANILLLIDWRFIITKEQSEYYEILILIPIGFFILMFLIKF